MTEPLTYTANDALAYLLLLVRERLEWGTDAIAGNIPSVNTSAAELYAGNEYVLDHLSDLIKDVDHIGARHVHATTYSDGRPVRSRIELEDGSIFSHLWHPDPAQESERRVELPRTRGSITVRIAPPSTLEIVNTRTLSAVADPEETNR
ncbi:hypothetical protein [Prescottella equi]